MKMKKATFSETEIIIIFLFGIISGLLIMFLYYDFSNIRDYSDQIKDLVSIDNRTYIKDVYDCSDFTIDAIGILKENNISSQFCWGDVIGQNSSHAWVGIMMPFSAIQNKFLTIKEQARYENITCKNMGDLE